MIPGLVERRLKVGAVRRTREEPRASPRPAAWQDHQHTARIHWMSDDAVSSGGNDTLVRPHFDNAGSPSVLPQREKDDVVTHRDYRIA